MNVSGLYLSEFFFRLLWFLSLCASLRSLRNFQCEGYRRGCAFDGNEIGALWNFIYSTAREQYFVPRRRRFKREIVAGVMNVDNARARIIVDRAGLLPYIFCGGERDDQICRLLRLIRMGL